jgi:D-tyrosyl-tRNA(Tyr) deacylase
MIGLLQRVQRARVTAEARPEAAIGAGLLVLVGVERDDDESRAQRLLERILGYRVFADEAGRMNRGLRQAGGSLLLVPQFTLAADTRKGTRASFQTAAPPETAQALFHHLCRLADAAHQPVAHGWFGADMAVELVNDGPVTFWLDA